MSSRQSSCKSLVVQNMKDSSSWVEYKNDLFDDYGGMDSGSHLLTLGRLYAWEKKLFEEVKVRLILLLLLFESVFSVYDEMKLLECVFSKITMC